jgi:murein DD-endopeptidase MepM/ murein hydrolase activator NlpD
VSLHRTILVCALFLMAPASASAASSGGVSVPSAPSVPTVETDTTKEQAPSGKRSSLDVSAFALNGSHFYEYGRSLRATFSVGGKRGTANLKLVFAQGGKRVRVVDLGASAAGEKRSVTVPTAGLPSGSLDVRLSGRDSRGRALKGAGTRTIDIRSHRFPVVGPHTFGGEGSRYGADRDGGKRKHQGQDVSAAEGTPMVAARGGFVRTVANQPSGAGVYIVIRGAGESRDYVYMHLVEGSPTVKAGDTVRTGQLIGKVGNTGASSGPHLHFEIWQGAWQAGGTPIDPLPLLQSWDSWS